MSAFRRTALTLALVVAMTATAIIPPSGAEEGGTAKSEIVALPDFPCRAPVTEVSGVGPLCDTEWGQKIFLRDGSFTYSHGPDAPPPEELTLATHPSRQPFCVENTAAEYHNYAIYARPHDKAGRYASFAGTMRDLVAQANGHLYAEAVETGGRADYRFACVSGVTTVADAVLPTGRNSDSFSTITSDLRSLGYDDPKAKYWVFYDDSVSCGCAGQGSLYLDSSRSVNNYNNGPPGAMFAISYGYESWSVLMHESGHNMGAVQKDAPGSNTLGHCNDGKDVMCYAEGGQPYDAGVCPDHAHFDCQHDTYFNTNPAPGSYLDTHWNIGWSANRFIEFLNTPPVMRAVSCSPEPSDSGSTATCALRATDSSSGVFYTVDWGDGSAPTRVPATGFAASGVDTLAPHVFTSVGDYTVTVTATDSDPSPLTSAPLAAIHSVTVDTPLMVSLGCAPALAGVNEPASCAFVATDSSDGLAYDIAWGDGSTTRVPGSGSVTPGAPQVANHAWSAPGTYTVTVFATDTGLPALTSLPVSVTHTVVYKPEFIAPSPCVLGATVEGVEGLGLSFNVAARTLSGTSALTMTLGAAPSGVILDAEAPSDIVNGVVTWPNPIAGDFTAEIVATDELSMTRTCIVPIHVVRLGGDGIASAFWVSTAAPASAEYNTRGASRATPGTSRELASSVTTPFSNVFAEGVTESVTITRGAGVATSRSTVTFERVAAAGLEFTGLEQDVLMSYDASTEETTVTSTPRIGRVSFLGVSTVLPPLDGPFTLDLPYGGRVAFLERATDDAPIGEVFRENLVHVYAPLAFGRTDFIIGASAVYAGVEGAPRARVTHTIDEADDARSGRDAGSDAATAVTVGPGVFDGGFKGSDIVDVYAIPIAHGENVKIVLEPAPEVQYKGGSAGAESGFPRATSPSGTSRTFEHLDLALIDPTGATRETDRSISTSTPSRVELNADETGTWLVKVTRANGDGRDRNYSVAITLSPVPLLPQRDGMSDGDAPDACTPTDPAIPTISNGAWAGVLRDDDRVDVYRFSALIGELIAATVKPGEDHDGFDAALTLLDRDCAVLDHSDMNTGLLDHKGMVEAVTRLPALYSGDYYLVVTRVNGVGNHYVTLTVQEPTPTVPGNDAGRGEDAPANPSQANFATSMVFQGRLEDEDAGDSYAFRFLGGRQSFLTFDMSAFSQVSLTLRRQNGAVVAPTVSALGQTAVWTFNVASTEDYRLTITPVYGGGNYVIAWWQRAGGVV